MNLLIALAAGTTLGTVAVMTVASIVSDVRNYFSSKGA